MTRDLAAKLDALRAEEAACRGYIRALADLAMAPNDLAWFVRGFLRGGARMTEEGPYCVLTGTVPENSETVRLVVPLAVAMRVLEGMEAQAPAKQGATSS
jgi:hypothetical protein